MDDLYEPTVSIIIPTYEEGATIRRKLDNIMQLDYPKAKMEIIIADSASKDNTINRVREWSAEHGEIKVITVQESERRGMVKALNEGLRYATGEIVVKTDADCLLFKDSLRNAMKYLADPKVGSVAGLHVIDAARQTSAVTVERTYRNFYRSLRIGESKLYGTVLYEGELMLVKRSLLDRVPFDESIGADDVPTALRMAELGYRAITAEDAYFREQTPYTWKIKLDQKIRRGRHVLQALWKYKHLLFKKNTPFHRIILPFEFYIYAVNPIITLIVAMLSVAMLFKYPWIGFMSTLLLIRSIREAFATHIVNSFIMVSAVVSELIGRERLTWNKIDEIREPVQSKSLTGGLVGRS
jgi:cellulose synthase/poly-beta-1,6-N-acetylglucosamine synthase-like glycosyltransferase